MSDARSQESGLNAYVRRLFAPEDAVLAELREEVRRRDMPEICISPDEGRLLQVLLTAIGARRVLEIGTLGGYSAIWMARALPPDGRLVTLERKPEHAEVARRFIRRAGLDDVVEVRVGAANDTLEQIAGEHGEPFDAFFIDADKAGYPAYLDWAEALVRPGGLVLGDNAFWSGRVLEEPPEDDDTLAMQRFNRRLADKERFCSTIIPVRDGLAVAVVRGETINPG